jgi:hypothetical protein
MTGVDLLMAEPDTGARPRYCYTLHGLTLHSEIALPQLQPVDPAPGDATIQYGKLESRTDDSAVTFRNWTAIPGTLDLNIYETGRFRISGGTEIIIDPLPDATQPALVSLVLGSAMSALLQQRKLLPLHASSVVTPGGAVLVTGRSGAGKSTLVAQLVGMGMPILADDVTAIRIESGGNPVAVAGLGSLRLWRDTLDALGNTDAGLFQVREDVLKYYLPVAERAMGAHPIRAIIRLSTKNQGPPDVRQTDRAEAVQYLAKHVHRKHFMIGMGLKQFAFDAAVSIARQTPMLEIIRSHDDSTPAQIAQITLDWLGTL